MNVIALVPARGGSKGIKDKNRRLLAGKPLLQYTLDAAIQSAIFDQIILSSDSQAILALAQDQPVIQHNRSETLAMDSTPTDPVILDIIQTFQLSDDDLVILLQPTSPLRTALDIQKAYQQFIQLNDAKLLLSVTPISNHLLYAYQQENAFITPVMPIYHQATQRQQLPDIFLPNGAIYIFRVKHFMRNHSIPDECIVPFIMEAERSVDIDNLHDWQLAEAQLHNQQGVFQRG